STSERVAAAKADLDDMDLEERRTLLRELDFRVEVGCRDWSAKPRERVYDMDVLWAGDPALLGAGNFARLFDHR
ncbi:MAG: hypothetical protein JXA57_08470, partial [Armatimonadetes bacterium]|nr:hypothetical protein [Armatimonadota bacterium]